MARPTLTIAVATLGTIAATAFVWNAAVADHGGTHSTTGVPIENVPAFPALEPVAINDDGWVAASGSLTTDAELPLLPGLGLPPTATIRGLNDGGTIVGTVLSGSFRFGFVRLADDTYPSIPAPYGGTGNQEFRSIADDGSILGRFFATTDQCGNATAGVCDFLMEANGDDTYTTHVLQDGSGLPLFANRAVAQSDGDVLVLSTNVVWSPADGLVTLTGDGVSSTWPVNGANAVGELVGTGNRTGSSVGLYWPSVGDAPVEVPPLAGHTHAQLLDIDAAGIAVGWSTSTPTDLQSGLPFAWDARTGSTTPLGTLPGGTWARPVDINDVGQVLGTASNGTDAGTVMWSLGGGSTPTTIDPIPAQTLTVGDLLYLTPVVRGNPPVGFGLFGGTAATAGPAPAGATVDPTTGVFTWRATDDQVGETTLTIVAWTDAVGTAADVPDEPHATFTVTVSPALEPVVLSLTDAIGVTDSVMVRPGARLQVGDSISIADTVSVLPGEQSAVGGFVGISDSISITVVGDLNDLDPDRDGIRSAVDGLKTAKSFVDASTVTSNDFSDAHRPGAVTDHAWGRVTKRGGGNLAISDDADPTWGVRAAVAGAVGLTRTSLAVCDAGHVLHLEGATSVRLRCGSVWVAVDSGLATLETSDGATIRIPAGSTGYRVDGEGRVRIEAFDGPLTVVNRWETRVLPAGSALDDPGLDTEAPELTVADLDVTLPAGVNSGVVTYETPVAADNAGPVTAVCDPASGATFGLGTTAVTCTATDPSGNADRATFTVTVTAATPSPTLPTTGGAARAAASWAMLLLATGVVLVTSTRRRITAGRRP